MPRSPMPQSMPQPTEPQPTEPPTDTPNETDEVTYDNEHTTPTPIRKRPSADTHAQHERIRQPPRASTPSLMDTLIAQNMQIMESNMQMMQAFMHIIERLTPSRPFSPPQPIANLYDDTKQQIKQLNETSKLVRPTYVKVKLANSRDWAKWNSNIRGYMASLRMPDILNASYEIPTKGTSECTIYNIQNTLLSSFILETVEQDYHYLLQEKTSAWEQYETLQKHLDLGQHAQRYYATKEMLAHHHTTFQSTVAAVTAFIARMRDANVRTLEDVAPYLFMAAISPTYGTAINALLTDKPHSMDIPEWTLEMAIRYFAMKQASKPRDYSSNKQDSSSSTNRQNAHSKQHEKQHEKQQDRQHDRQQSKPRCPDCGKNYPGAPATSLPLLQHEPNNLPPIPMAMDNQGAIALATLGSQNRRTRHINVRYHYIRECVESGIIAPHYTPTSDMLADGLTKVLDHQKFSTFVSSIDVRDSIA